jgi:hypothetical protein
MKNEKQGTHTHAAEVGTLAGELAGAVIGSAAGPVGAVAGMVIGAVAGDLAGHVLDDDARRHAAHEEALDDAIGVTSGGIGVARAGSPSPRIGAPAPVSCGVTARGGATAAEGPIQDSDDHG